MIKSIHTSMPLSSEANLEASMLENEDEDKYEKPDVTQIVHALIIYGLVVFIGFFLLIGLANKPEPVTKNIVTMEERK